MILRRIFPARPLLPEPLCQEYALPNQAVLVDRSVSPRPCGANSKTTAHFPHRTATSGASSVVSPVCSGGTARATR